MRDSILKYLIVVFIFIAMQLPCHAGQKITVGVYNFSPLVFSDEAGKVQGFFPETLNYIAEKEGWEIKYVPGSWSECLTRLQNGEIDLQVCIAYSDERSRLLDFSEYLLLDWASVFKKKGSHIQTIFDLNDKTVSVVKSGITTDEFKKVIEQFGISCRIIEKNENGEILKAVHDGEVDAGICPNIYGTMLQSDYKIERTSIVFSPIKLRFATKKAMNQQIMAVLNKHISELKADRSSIYYKLLNKWTGSYEKKVLPQWVLLTLVIFISASIVLLLFNIILKKRVRLKTAELIVANKELRFSEERMTFVLEGSQLGYWDWDITTGHVQRNSRWAEMLGYTIQEIELNVKQWTDLHHPDDKEAAWKSINDHMEGRSEIHKIEYRMLTKDGQYKWILDCAKIVRRDEQGRPVRMSGTHTDITEWKQAEKTLKESEARFKALHNASFGGIAIHDKGIILDCNQGLSKISGYSVDELIGMNGLLLIETKWRNMVLSNILTGYEKPYEAVGVRKNGEEYPIRLEGRAIPYQGMPVRVVEFRDITEIKLAEEEQKKLQAQLSHAQKMESVGRLAGGVAHDFNNMLGVILGHTEMLLYQISPGQPFYADLQKIQMAGERSANLVRQLLAFARKQTVARKVLDLNNTVESMLTMLRRLISEDIRLNWVPGKNLWSVKIDPSQIDQILANLCVNARDAITGVGNLTIETENSTFDEHYCSHHQGFIPGDYVLLAVSDTGCGMEKETLENLFEPFFTTKEMGKGTGLGLATVYGIVKQNNGFINVYSEPDQGTSFRIYLPRYVGKSEHNPQEDKTELLIHGNETILLVEDEPSLLEMTTMMLQSLGYTVLAASNPGESMYLAREHKGRIDMLITDVVMPEMNGRDLAKQLLSLHSILKCLFMSGYTANVITHHGVLDEDVHFIQKPFSVNQLATKIREVLEK